MSAERIMVELAGSFDRGHLGRAFRESCRLGCCTPDSIARSLRGQRGTSSLAALCHRYGALPYWRCRSDAESRGLEVLHDAGGQMPESKEFHPFEIDDLDKKRRWESAGYTVRYAWPADIYDHPHRLVAICLG